MLPGAMDPAGAAELYGYINAGMWTVMPQLEQLTRIPDPASTWRWTLTASSCGSQAGWA